MSGKNKAGLSQYGTNNPTVDDTSMVRTDIGHVSKRTNATATITRPPIVTAGNESPTRTNQSVNISGVEGLKRRLEAEGFSEATSELMLESRRPGTKLAYRGPWEKWCRWAREREINPLQASLANVGNFLTESQQSLEYSTLNTYRSAISAYHPQIDGHPIGQHPHIKQILRGAFNRKTPKPKYLKTWDVDVVLKSIKGLGQNSSLSLKHLSQKLTMLIALTATLRGGELSKLDPENMDDAGDHIIFRFGDLTKTTSVTNPLCDFVRISKR